MDYQEAIYCMKVLAGEDVCEECNYYQSCDHTKQADMARIAISAMQELQSLHDQGFSMERLRDIDFRKEVVEHINYYAYMELQDELEEYRELWTLEEVRESMKELQMYKDSKLVLIPDAVHKKQCEELDEYKKIGTLEEVREAMEKQKAKKPIIQPWSPAICPTCGEELSENLGDGYYRHRTFLERCTNVECAQRLDWSDVE